MARSPGTFHFSVCTYTLGVWILRSSFYVNRDFLLFEQVVDVNLELYTWVCNKYLYEESLWLVLWSLCDQLRSSEWAEFINLDEVLIEILPSKMDYSPIDKRIQPNAYYKHWYCRDSLRIYQFSILSKLTQLHACYPFTWRQSIRHPRGGWLYIYSG